MAITYTRARTRAVYRKSIDELYELLDPMTGPTAASGCSNLPSIRLLKAKQELIGVTADRRIEHIFAAIIVLVCKN